MGLGHVPSGPVRELRAGGHLQRRQHRGAPREGVLLTAPRAGGDRRRALGTAGEDRAAQWYSVRGYEILDRNWRSRVGEIDLVLRRDRTLVFSEVKTRSGRSFGEPFEAVTAAKQSRIRRLAAEWLRSHRVSLPAGPLDVRFDVVSVTGARIDVIEEAF